MMGFAQENCQSTANVYLSLEETKHRPQGFLTHFRLLRSVVQSVNGEALWMQAARMLAKVSKRSRPSQFTGAGLFAQLVGDKL